MSVSLRPATVDDLDAVIEVLMSCWRENIAQVAPASAIAAITPERIRPMWMKSLNGDDAFGALLAENDSGEVVGITRYQRAPDGTGIVHSLHVSPKAQRLGIGARLLSAAAEGLRGLGVRRLTLWVLASNAPSLAFYRAQGWTPDGKTRVQPEFGVDELRLEFTGPESLTATTAANHDVLTAAARELVESGPNAPAGVAIGLRAEDREFTGVAGLRGPGSDSPLTVDTRHDLASITKVLATTTALIRLVSSQDLRLDDPVARYLPGFSGDGKEAVTVRLLLQHRGGLWEWQPLYLGGRTGIEAMRYVERLPLRYGPDTGRHYSDLGFILLGRIVETVFGADLEAATRQLVTEPLGLAATGFAGTDDATARAVRDTTGFARADDATARAPRAAERPDRQPPTATSAVGQAIEQRMVATGDPYPVLDAETSFDGWRSGPITGEVNDGNAFHAFGGVSGHAGLFSTLGDLLTYATALARYRDHDDLWNPRVVETFLADGPDPEQVLGFRRYRLDVDGAETAMYGHPGFVGCAVGFSPAAGVALALCSNRLLTPGTPTPNDDLWSRTRAAASTVLSQPSGNHEGDNE